MLQVLKRVSFLQGFLALSALWVLIISVLDQGQDERVDVPDFASIETVQEKKQAFFEFFGAMAEAENTRLLSVREELQNNPSQKTLNRLAERYRVEISDPATEKDIEALLERVDVIPRSLVLAQAAIESGWGTSRFAKQGYNFFGQWCFSKGCGLVPNDRPAGANHEVRQFDSPMESVQAYFRNINSHPTYEDLRALRAKARASDQPIHGCVLAAGLLKYSERGQHYVDEVRQMIRFNDLTPYSEAPCASQAKTDAA